MEWRHKKYLKHYKIQELQMIKAITKLNEHFNVKKNVPYERSVFREAKQERNESLDQFITRLRNSQHTVNMEITLMMKLEIKSYTHLNRQNYELDYYKNKI